MQSYVLIGITITVLIYAKPLHAYLSLFPVIQKNLWIISFFCFLRDSYLLYRACKKIKIFFNLIKIFILWLASFINNPNKSIKKLTKNISILKLIITNQLLIEMKIASFLFKYLNFWILKQQRSYKKILAISRNTISLG
jgi:hypothetical protein